MGTIALEEMRFFARHGYYPEEQTLGNFFTVSIEIDTDFKIASQNDELNDTLNYEVLYLVVKHQMTKPAALLETVVQNIANDLKNQFDTIKRIRIRVAKENPPLGGPVARAVIALDETYEKKCSKCGKNLICYNDKYCWCQNLVVSPEIMKTLKNQYKDCICRKCLEAYTT